MKKLPPSILAFFDLYTDHVDFRDDPDGSFLSARTSSIDRPEAMQGVHSPGWVLLVGDEASGIAEAVYEAAVGSMSGHNACTVLISNPTRSSGLFFKTHHQLRDSWCCFHVGCVGNPLVKPDFIAQVAETWGEDSNQYRVRVLGEFPLRDDDALIAAELVDGAMGRDIAEDPDEELVYGVDIARKGSDRSVLVKRRGNVVLELSAWNGDDLMASTGRIVAEATVDQPAEIMVDSIGVGAGVADRLRELGFSVRDVNVGEAAAMNPQAARLRDELWLAVKDWLGTRACRLPRDDELRQELVAPGFDYLSNGKLKVESKEDLKRRGFRSPDKADALCCTFAGRAAIVGGRAHKWLAGKPLKRNIRGLC
jgi:hypothetical protein